jgi:hypothetical protein
VIGPQLELGRQILSPQPTSSHARDTNTNYLRSAHSVIDTSATFISTSAMSFLAPRARLVPRLLTASRPFSSSPVASTSAAQPDSPAPDATSAPPPVSELAPEPTDPTEAEAAPLDPEPVGRAGKGFRAWLASDGARFRHGIKGQTNWIGETVSCPPLVGAEGACGADVTSLCCEGLASREGASVVLRATTTHHSAAARLHRLPRLLLTSFLPTCFRLLTPCRPLAQPFPLNPSFRPLAPLADATKTRIFNTYVHNIIQPTATDSVVVRAISEKFGVSMDRIRAIIRLKELEKSWKDSVRLLCHSLIPPLRLALSASRFRQADTFLCLIIRRASLSKPTCSPEWSRTLACASRATSGVGLSRPSLRSLTSLSQRLSSKCLTSSR